MNILASIIFNIVVAAAAAFVAYAIGADPQLTAKNFLFWLFAIDGVLLFLSLCGAFESRT